LFRTDILQKIPFPLDYGKAGDGAWSLQNAGALNWAATPEKVTTFRIHPPTSSISEVQAGLASTSSKEFAEMARNSIERWLESGASDVPVELRRNIKQLVPLISDYEKFCRHYTSLRKGKWPWIVKPSAWNARYHRNLLRSRFNLLIEQIYQAH
jgi:hypothetical protein